MNEATLHPLSKAQSDFAAENYNLVFRFLQEKGLDADEYHDDVILEYLHAVQCYDERPELRRYDFPAIAYGQMESAISHTCHRQLCAACAA